MRANKLYFVLGGAIAVLMIFWVSRSIAVKSANEPMLSGGDTVVREHAAKAWTPPPPGQPLTLSYESLKSQAQIGNLTAARRLYSNLATCTKRRRLESFFEQLERDPSWKKSMAVYAGPNASGDSEAQVKILKGLQDNLELVENNRELCEGASNLLDDGSIYQPLIEAARLGDATASACLLDAPYSGAPLSKADAEAYRNYAIAYAKQALRKGSWKAAAALLNAYSETDYPPSGYAQYVHRSSPPERLKYAELLRLGAYSGSVDAKTLDGTIAYLYSQVEPAQVAFAQRWAREAYKNYFQTNGKEEGELSSSPCVW